MCKKRLAALTLAGFVALSTVFQGSSVPAYAAEGIEVLESVPEEKEKIILVDDEDDTRTAAETSEEESSEEIAVSSDEDEAEPVKEKSSIDAQGTPASDDWLKYYKYELDSNHQVILKGSNGKLLEDIVTDVYIPAKTEINGEIYTTVIDNYSNAQNSVSFWENDFSIISSIKIEDGVIGRDCAFLFASLDNLKEPDDLDIRGLKIQSTSLAYMFASCGNLKSIDLSGLDTSNVSNMNGMFSNCESLETINFGNFDTSGCFSMQGLFYNCISLNYLDLSSFDTSKVDDMSSMFYLCDSLKEIDLSSFDTSSVKNMNHMFYCCDSLIYLDLSNFDTRACTDFSYMFNGCSSNISSLDLRSFTFGQNANTHSMFSYHMVKLYFSKYAPFKYDFTDSKNNGAYPLFTEIYYEGTESDWAARNNVVSDQTEVLFNFNGTVDKLSVTKDKGNAVETDWYKDYNYYISEKYQKLVLLSYKEGMSDQYDGKVVVPAQTKINGKVYTTLINNVENNSAANKEYSLWYDDYDNITSIVFEDGVESLSDISYLFRGMTELVEVDLSGLNTGNVVNMSWLFCNDENLENVIWGNIDTSEVRNMKDMFHTCTTIESIDFSKFDTSAVIDMSSMFFENQKLQSLDLTSFNTSKVRTMETMFDQCRELREVDLSSFDTKNVKDMSGMFQGCRSLINLDVSSFNTEACENFSYMFDNISKNISTLDLSSFSFGQYANIKSMLPYGIVKLYLSKNAPYEYEFTDSDGEGIYPIHTDIYYAGTEKGWVDRKNKLPDYTEVHVNFSGSVDKMEVTADKGNAVETEWYKDYNYYISEKFKKLVLLSYKDGMSEKSAGKIVVPAQTKINGQVYTTLLDNSGNGKGSLWLEDSDKITSIVFENGVETLSDISYLFSGMNELVELDLSGLDTSKVVNISHLFYSDQKLEKLILTGFKTSEVRSMESAFGFCMAMKSFDLSSFDTSSVLDMSGLFYRCTTVEFIDLSPLDTSKVRDMSYMFFFCDVLKEVEVGSFNTSKVLNISAMFAGCCDLIFYDVSGFDTSSVVNYSDMFSGLNSNHSSIDLRNFEFKDYSNAKSILPYSVVKAYFSKKAPNNSELKYQQLTDIYYAGTESQWKALNNTVGENTVVHFDYNGTAPKITVTEDKGNAVESDWYEDYNYYISKKYKKIVLFSVKRGVGSKYDGKIFVPAQTKIDGEVYTTLIDNSDDHEYSLWFNDYNNIKSIAFGDGVETLSDISGLFRAMDELVEVDLSGLNTTDVTNMSRLFCNDKKLAKIILTGINTDEVRDMNSMFYDVAPYDKTLDLRDLNIGKKTNTDMMFTNNMDKLYLAVNTVSNFDFAEYYHNITDIYYVGTKAQWDALNNKVSDTVTMHYECGTDPISYPVAVTGVTLSPKTLELQLKSGEVVTGQLTATVAPEDADNKNVTYSSDKEAVATVDATGKVTAVAEGTATITVKTEDGNFTDTCVVTVKKEETEPDKPDPDDPKPDDPTPDDPTPDEPVPEVKSIVLSKHSMELTKDDTATLLAFAYPASDKVTLTFTSSDASVATVTKGDDANSAVIKALKKGDTVIKVTAGKVTAECKVTVIYDVKDEDEELKEDSLWIGEAASFTYDGDAKRPEPNVYYGDKLLEKGVDYTYSYKNNKKAALAGTSNAPTVTVKFKGNYTGSLSKEFNINKAEISVAEFSTVFGYVKTKKVKGNTTYVEQKLSPVITYNGKTLKNGRDYELYYDDKQDGAYAKAGEYVINISGIGNFSGKATVIEKLANKQETIDIKKASAVRTDGTGNKAYAYTGEEIKPEYKLTYDGKTLEKDKDYEVVYSNNVKVGTAKVTFAAKGDTYFGTKTVSFKIQLVKKSFKDNKNLDIVIDDGDTLEFVKGGVKPEVTVYLGDEELEKGVDYKVSYKNANKISQGNIKGQVVVTGIGAYKDSASKSYTIVKQDISNLNIVVNDFTYSTKKNAYRSTKITVYDLNGKALSASDYTVDKKTAFNENEDWDAPSETPAVGDVVSVTVHATEKSNYKGEITGSFKIVSKAQRIDKATITFKSGTKVQYDAKKKAFIYDGTDVEPDKSNLTVTLKVKDGKSTRTVSPTYEIVGYQNNYKTGTAKITIRGIGEYGGLKTVNFKITGRKTNTKK